MKLDEIFTDEHRRKKKVKDEKFAKNVKDKLEGGPPDDGFSYDNGGSAERGTIREK